MNTNYAAPVATRIEDTFVPMAEWRKVYASYKRGEVLKTSAKD